MKTTITIDYWEARRLLDIGRSARKFSKPEVLAWVALRKKLEQVQRRIKKAAEDDEEFGGMHFPEDVRRIMQDDLSEPVD